MVWVRRIFEMIADGHSIYEVAQYLRRTGAPLLAVLVGSGTGRRSGTSSSATPTSGPSGGARRSGPPQRSRW